ncbi:fatty acid desaturase [Oceanispirochaeta crateris]|nr:fatty acid desaturase [Oceanispirochaeta crateris]
MVRNIQFYRTPIDREALRTLTQRKDLPGLIQCLSLLTVYLFTTWVSFYFFRHELWIPMVMACYIHAMLSSFLGMEATVHELSHKTPFKSKSLNEIFYGLFSFLSWNNPIHFRESHKRHHQVTVFKGLDKEVVLSPAPFHMRHILSWFLFDYQKFKNIMRGNLSYALGRDIPDTFYWDPLFEKDDPQRQSMFLWSRFLILGHLIFLGLFIYFQLWVFIFTFTCSYFFVTFLGRFTGIVQHIGLKPSVPDWRMTCHTMVFGPVISFFYWRMNYHIEHHMFAAVPFYNLPKLHALMAADTPLPVKGFIRGVKKIMSLMKEQRKNPEWVYIPDLPAGAGPAKMT